MLEVCYYLPGCPAPQRVVLTQQDGVLYGKDSHLALRITLSTDEKPGVAGHRRHQLWLRTATSLRLELRLALPAQDRNAFHLLPGVIFGDNNLSISTPGHFPNLSDAGIESWSVSPVWKIRTDRCAAPVAMAFAAGGGHLAVALPPYIDLPDGSDIRTGLIAQLPGTVGFSIGHAWQPNFIIHKNQPADPREEAIPGGAQFEMVFDTFCANDGGRDQAYAIVRYLYQLYDQSPQASVATDACMDALAQAIATDLWDDERSVFHKLCGKISGGQIVFQKRISGGIAWSGGLNAAFPMLVAARRSGRADWLRIARRAIDHIATFVNPATGLFFDAFDKDGGPTINSWWSYEINRDCHSAYTNAQATYYFLRASSFEKSQAGADVPRWHEPALGALETMLALAREDGHFGYAYHARRREVVNWDGFAGCWWNAAFCEAFKLTADQKYLHAAERGIQAYARQLPELDIWGTPMDTWKANDQESILALIRSARLLHQITAKEQYLAILAQAADYEFLWRYLYNTRPDARPLRSSGWHSCGGSLTSVSNPHIHPMAMLIVGDLQYLYEKGGDEHVRQRMEDGLIWCRNCLELFPDKTGFGSFGWTGERYCPSDGLLISHYPDASPASVDLDFDVWSAGAMLEGLLCSAGELP